LNDSSTNADTGMEETRIKASGLTRKSVGAG